MIVMDSTVQLTFDIINKLTEVKTHAIPRSPSSIQTIERYLQQYQSVDTSVSNTPRRGDSVLNFPKDT